MRLSCRGADEVMHQDAPTRRRHVDARWRLTTNQTPYPCVLIRNGLQEYRAERNGPQQRVNEWLSGVSRIAE